jgi:hypothetical protein
MPHLDCIKEALAPAHWNEARRDFFARFLVALLTAQTACLYRLASLFPSEAQIASRYQRIRRFFGHFAFEEADLVSIVLRLADKAGAKAPFVLAFDRTEWHLGKSVVNVFLLGILVGKVVFPLTWILLDKAGSSNTNERISLLKQAVSLLGKEQIAFVVGDREFASEGLLAWLNQAGIGFRLRLRADYLITNGHGEAVCGDWLFRRGKIGKEQPLSGRRWCLGQALFLSGMRFVNEKGEIEFLIVASDVPAPLCDYGLRWSIENLFSGLKSRGFDLEATHLVEQERLSRLLWVLTIAFCWCVAVGSVALEEREKAGKVIHKKGLGRLAKSALRTGVDTLRSLLAPLCGNFKQADFQKAIQFLYGT